MLITNNSTKTHQLCLSKESNEHKNVNFPLLAFSCSVNGHKEAPLVETKMLFFDVLLTKNTGGGEEKLTRRIINNDSEELYFSWRIHGVYVFCVNLINKFPYATLFNFKR